MNRKLLLIAGAAITSAGVYSASVMAVTATGSSTARVVEAITILNTTTLAFGDIVSGVAGTVTIAPGGGLSGSLTPTGTTSAGAFDVDGQDSKTYAITLPASATITDPVSTDTMTVNGFTHKYGIGSGTIPVGVADSLTIGATLNVGGGETAGSYTGTYIVGVDYN